MDKVTISNLQGESGLVNVVRYFLNKGSEYLIYSLNEVDEAGYTRLYVTKINGVDGMYNAETLNDAEWNEIKNLIKLIVKANKEGMPVPVQDLNPKKINNIVLKDKKVFKLNAPLVNDLGNNKTNFGEQDNNTQFESQVQPTFDIPNNTQFESQVQPTFDIPNNTQFESQVQPTFNMPNNTQFESQVQPTFNIPNNTQFESQVQPTFDIPNNTQFESQVQPTFNIPNNTAFEQQVQPTFTSPMNSAFDMLNSKLDNQQNSSENMMNFGLDSSNSENYKNMYDAEKKKNDEMQSKINELENEIEQYKSIIGNIKNMLEK